MTKEQTIAAMARAMAEDHSEEALAAYDAGSAAVGYWNSKATAAYTVVQECIEGADDWEPAFRAARLCDGDHASTCFEYGWKAALAALIHKDTEA